MVDILMATYNGAKFVEDQLLSFYRQSYTNWRCIMHDDGSTDGTVDILRAWTEKDPRFILKEDGVKGLGPAKHFIYLLQYSDAPWVMWSDQDDIWFENKVETMLQAGEKAHFKDAGVVYANAELWNPQQGIISKRNTLYYPHALKDMLFLNSGVQGASALFNAPMRSLMLEPEETYAMHDHTLLLVAVTMGEIVYVDKALMYYRQHEDNVTGNAPGSKRKKLMLMWAHRHEPIIFTSHYNATRAFYSHFQNSLSNSDKRILEIFLNLPQYGWFKRFFIIVREHFTLLGSRYLLWIKLCLRRYI
ncbi:MAG: glycosyltransferase family 2 protein [Paludibacteraceae bacterium]|nr:glycosyltransferase family 2 protein [Paludibacteraceae bacterium]